MDSIIEMYGQLNLSRGETRTQLMRDYFFAVSQSNARFRIVHSCAAGSKNDICVVEAPESYFEEEGSEPGFLGRNLSDDERFLAVNELTDRDRELSREFEFPILNWEEFIECFVPVFSPEMGDDGAAQRTRKVIDGTRGKHSAKAVPASESHPIMTLSAFLCALAGVLLLSTGSQEVDSGAAMRVTGLGLVILFVLGFGFSRCWTRVERLRGVKKALSLAPTVVGGIISGLVVLALIAAWIAPRSDRRGGRS